MLREGHSRKYWSEYVLLGALAFVGMPLIVVALFVFAIPFVSGDPLISTALWAIGLFLCVITVGNWMPFLPKKDIQNFRRQDGSFEIPPRSGAWFLGTVMQSVMLLVGPVLLPLAALFWLYVLVTDPAELAPLLSEWSITNAWETLDLVVGIPGTIAVLIWMILVPRLVPGMWKAFKRHLASFGKPALLIDERGIADLRHDRRVSWDSISDVLVSDFTSIRLLGGTEIEAQRFRLPKHTPKEWVELIGPGLIINVGGLPISSQDLAALVRSRAPQ